MTNSQTWGMAYAVTYDFVSFYKQGPLLGPGTTGWELQTAFRGAAFLDGGTIYMPYTGNSGSGWAWGVASLPATGTAFDPWSVVDFNDDFGGAAVDADAWKVYTSTSTFSVSSGQLHATTTTGSLGTLFGTRTFGVGYMLETYSIDNNPLATSKCASEVGFGNLARTSDARIFAFDSAYWRKSTDGGGATIANMTEAIDNSWHTRRVWLQAAANSGFKLDAGSWQYNTTKNPVIQVPPWIFSYRTTGYNPSMDFDYVRVRQYIEPEPSVVATEIPLGCPKMTEHYSRMRKG
jgi:hypothetical protein